MARDTSEIEWLGALNWIRAQKIRPSPPDTRLPSEDALAKESRYTKSIVRRALQQLVANEEITSKKGSGYYTLFNFNRSVSLVKALEPNTINVDYTEVNDMKIVNADDDVSKYLKIRPGEKIIYFKTKRFVCHNNKKRPCLMSTHYIRNDKVDFKNFTRNLQACRSVSSAIREERVTAYLRTFTDINSRFPLAEERKALLLSPLDIVIETRGVNSDFDKDPIELTISCWPSHIWNMRFEFQ